MRINVVGTSGSGKSTVGKLIAEGWQRAVTVWRWIIFTILLAVVIRVWTSSFRLLPLEILSIPRWVALFVADISLLFRYHLCSFVQLNVSIVDFCSLMRYIFELAWHVCMSSMDCNSHGSFDINVTSSATVGIPQ